MYLDAAALRASQNYALLTSLVVPRPIAWVSTQSTTGTHNLAPFSYFSGIGSDPPMISISIADKVIHGGADADNANSINRAIRKDTLRNIEETGIFCINLVEEMHLTSMNQTSADYATDVDEFGIVGLPKETCQQIPCVRIKSARAALECRLLEIHRYGRRQTTNLVIGEIVGFYLDESILSAKNTEQKNQNEYTVDMQQLRPVARLGQTWFATLGQHISLSRPKV